MTHLPVLREFHNDVFSDRFEWLRDQDAPATLRFYEQQNARAAARLAPLNQLADRLVDEIAGHTEETDRSVPNRSGAWWYFRRTIEGLEYPLHMRCPVREGEEWQPPVIDPGCPVFGEETLLDENAAAEGHEFFDLGSFDISPDGTRLLFAVDTVGDERYTLWVREIASGAVLAGPVENTFAGAFFSADGETVVYPTVDDAWRPDTLWAHRIGSEGPDVQLLHEPDDRFWLDADLDLDEQTVVITSASSVTSEVRFLTPEHFSAVFADGAAGLPAPVWPRQDGIDASLTPLPTGPDRPSGILIIDNVDHENFSLRLRIESLPSAADTASTSEILLIPGSDEIRLESVSPADTWIAVEYRRAGLPRVAAVPNAALLRGFSLLDFELGDSAGLVATTLAGMQDRRQPLVRVATSSLVQATAIWDVDPFASDTAAAWQLLKRRPTPGYHPEEYVEWREWATAQDGTRIPLSLIARREFLGAALGGTASEPAPLPTHLYGYGAYEVSIDPAFSATRLTVLDRGALFAIAHVRGGGELGRGWYEGGRLAQKPNTFSDFVACAEHLVERGISAPDRIVAEGRSAGGLLMGAVANLAPERFAGILAGVPFVDPLTSMLDPELPLTVVEWDEWGNPIEDPEIYRIMRSYSPYEGVSASHKYPEILAVTSLNDTRVLAVEPAKWVAALQEAGASAFLKTEMSGGHGGVSGRTAEWAERAGELAWVLDQLGLRDAPSAALPRKHHAEAGARWRSAFTGSGTTPDSESTSLG